MSKYIKVDDLQAFCDNQIDHSITPNCFQRMNHLEIVKCKDCKWWDQKDGSKYGYCHACKHGYSSPNWEIGIYRVYDGDWFCADGELKET